MRIQLSSTNGLLSLTKTHSLDRKLRYLQGTGSSDSIVQFEAVLRDAQLAVSQLLYSGSLNFNGPDFIFVDVTDLSQRGGSLGFVSLASAGLTTSKWMTVQVIPVNDAPVIHMPLNTLLVQEDTSFPVSGVYVTDADIQVCWRTSTS